MAGVRQDAALNPFDRITEDNETGERRPIGVGKKAKRVRVKPPRRTFGGSNGDEEFIHF